MVMGRPTKYLPEYCDQLIKHMELGYAFETFAAKIKDKIIARSTLYYWVEKFKDFSDAKKYGELLSLAEWERMGKLIAAGKIKNANASVWIFTMKCRFKWQDKPMLDDIDLNKISSDELQEIISRLRGELAERKDRGKNGNTVKGKKRQ